MTNDFPVMDIAIEKEISDWFGWPIEFVYDGNNRWHVVGIHPSVPNADCYYIIRQGTKYHLEKKVILTTFPQDDMEEENNHDAA